MVIFIETYRDSPKKRTRKDSELSKGHFSRLSDCPVSHEMSISFETVPKNNKSQRFRTIPKTISRDSSNGLESLLFSRFLGTVSMNMIIS